MRQVSYEVSKLCDVVGYNGPRTQSEVQEWLRNKHNCFVDVSPAAHKNGVNWEVQVLFYDNTTWDCWSNKSSACYGDNGEFPTYEDALEFGLKLALEIL